MPAQWLRQMIDVYALDCFAFVITKVGKVCEPIARLRIHYKEEPYLVHTFYLLVRTCPSSWDVFRRRSRDMSVHVLV